MAFKHDKHVFITVGLILLIIIIVAALSSFWPRYEKQFFELGLLGKDQKAEEYFSNENSTLEIGHQVNWYIYIHNGIGSAQNVIIRIKLLNSTMMLPNDQEHTPSPSVFFSEVPAFLAVNDTILIPFSWGVSDAFSQNNSVNIRELNVNGQNINVNVSDSKGNVFCLAFELWVYDQSSRNYSFAWKSGNDFSSASVNLQFRIK